MYTTTDLIVLLLLIFFVYRGWRRGLLRSLIGPAALVICWVIAMIHYDLNKNIFTALSIAIGGTFILTIAAHIVLSLMRLTVDKEYRDYVFWRSRLLGGLLNLVWKGAMIGLILLALALVPPGPFGLQKMHNDITGSFFYAQAQRIVSAIKPAKDTVDTLEMINDSHYLDKLSETKEYEALMNDKQIRDLRQDPEIAEMMDKKDIAGLMSNPKIIKLMQDEEFVKKLNELSRKAYEQKQRDDAAEEEGRDDPFRNDSEGAVLEP